MSERVTYLPIGAEQIFVTHHTPTAARFGSTAVMLVPPFGWEDVASYRARRVWAGHLAQRGHHVVRIDLPGTGDSAGELNVPDRYDTWREAVVAVAAWLREVSEAPRLAAIGIGTGGYLVADAVGAAVVEEAVLWATPETGKRYLREFAAFSALEADRIVEAGGPPPRSEKKGREAGGFVIDDGLAEAIGRNDIAMTEFPPSARLLLLDRDGAGLVDQLAEKLRARAVDVEAAVGSGYADMITRPDWSKPPREVFEAVDGWLARGESMPPATVQALAVPTQATDLIAGPVREYPFELEHDGVVLRGVLAEPKGGERAPLTLLFVNAGAVRRTGPHRLWVETARRWAEDGVPSLRLDLEGIGDSDGDGEMYRDVARFHDDRLVDQVRSALDALVANELGSRFVVIGLCSGGSWAFHSARTDARVSGAVMVNPRILYWHPNLDASRALRRRTRGLARSRTWLRLARGKITVGRMSQFVASVAATGLGALGVRAGTSAADVFEWQRRNAIEGFTSLRDAGRSAYFVFCDGEPLADELTEDGLLDQSERWPNIRSTRLPGMDHTLSPVWMHSSTHHALDEAIRRELGFAQASEMAVEVN